MSEIYESTVALTLNNGMLLTLRWCDMFQTKEIDQIVGHWEYAGWFMKHSILNVDTTFELPVVMWEHNYVKERIGRFEAIKVKTWLFV
jgi:hypothetical protein